MLPVITLKLLVQFFTNYLKMFIILVKYSLNIHLLGLKRRFRKVFIRRKRKGISFLMVPRKHF